MALCLILFELDSVLFVLDYLPIITIMVDTFTVFEENESK